MSNEMILIGARGGSKRIPNKNLAEIGNRTLLDYTLQAALTLSWEVFVSTDSEEIMKEAFKYQHVKVIKRPSELASDTSTDFDWITHALSELEKDGWHIPSKIVFLRPTTPFRDVNVIKTGIDSLKEGFTSLRSVEPLKEAIEKSFRVDNDTLYPAFPFYEGQKMIYKTNDLTNLPNQTFVTSYTANGYVDILLPETIKKGSLYGDKIQAYITPNSLEIDNLEDLDYANWKSKKK